MNLFKCPACRTVYADAYYGDHCKRCILEKCRCVPLVRQEAWEPDNGADYEELDVAEGECGAGDAGAE